MGGIWANDDDSTTLPFSVRPNRAVILYKYADFEITSTLSTAFSPNARSHMYHRLYINIKQSLK